MIALAVTQSQVVKHVQRSEQTPEMLLVPEMTWILWPDVFCLYPQSQMCLSGLLKAAHWCNNTVKKGKSSPAINTTAVHRVKLLQWQTSAQTCPSHRCFAALLPAPAEFRVSSGMKQNNLFVSVSAASWGMWTFHNPRSSATWAGRRGNVSRTAG